jgi:hypothetical protein
MFSLAENVLSSIIDHNFKKLVVLNRLHVPSNRAFHSYVKLQYSLSTIREILLIPNTQEINSGFGTAINVHSVKRNESMQILTFSVGVQGPLPSFDL